MRIINLLILCLCLILGFPFSSDALESVTKRARLMPPMDISVKNAPQNHVSANRSAQVVPDRKLSPTSQKILALNVLDFIKLVREKNERIIFQQLEWAVSKEAVKGERSIFEPSFVGSAQHEKNRKRNTVEEIIARSSSLFQGADPGTFDERNNDYRAAIEALLQVGTQVSLGYTLRDITNNLSDPVSPGLNEYHTFLGANVQQPLLRGRGIKPTMAKIWIAEADANMTFQAYRQEMMSVVFDAASAYWDLYLAQEKFMTRKDSVRIAEELLKHNREWVKAGRMAETEVLEAEAGLALRKSLESAAEQDVVSAMNIVRIFFSSSHAENEIPVRATDQLKLEKADADFSLSLKQAFTLRPEYLSSLKKTEREGISIAFAENQRWPQLDLKASYGLNGLDSSLGGSWDDATSYDFESYTIGLELRIPLGGDKKSRSELEVARKRKKQALLEVKAVEVSVANATDTAVRNLYSTHKQGLYYSDAVRLRQRLLDVEFERFKAGKSDSRLLLEREGDLLDAKGAELESLVNYKKAALELERAEGSLLLSHDIEIMEKEK